MGSWGLCEALCTPPAASAYGAGLKGHIRDQTYRERENEGSINQKLYLGVPQVAVQQQEHIRYPSTSPTSLISSKAQPMILSLFLVRRWISHTTAPLRPFRRTCLQKNSDFKVFQAPLQKIPCTPVRMCWNLASSFSVTMHKTCAWCAQYEMT